MSINPHGAHDDPGRLTWPDVEGFFQFTEAMDPTEKCDLHPDITFWECWVKWFRSRGIQAKAVSQQAWVAVYRENFK